MILINELQGDASTRRFFRFKTDDKTLIKIQYQNLSTDIDLIKKFEEKQKIFASCKVAVPEIYELNLKEGSILVSDLGTTHLADLDLNKNSNIYQKVIENIILYQTHKHELKESFTRELFIKELVQTYQYFIKPKLLEKKVNLQYFEEKYLNLIDKLVETQMSQDFKLVHRDLHSRNIMLKDNDLFLIDFQDARLGPYAYDLASLFSDPYNSYTANNPMVSKDFEHHIKEYAKKLSVSYAKILEDYKVNSMQRLLKMLGTFTYLSKEKNKNSYLQYLPTTLKKINELVKNDFTEWKEINSVWQ